MEAPQSRSHRADIRHGLLRPCARAPSNGYEKRKTMIVPRSVPGNGRRLLERSDEGDQVGQVLRRLTGFQTLRHERQPGRGDRIDLVARDHVGCSQARLSVSAAADSDAMIPEIVRPSVVATL